MKFRGTVLKISGNKTVKVKVPYEKKYFKYNFIKVQYRNFLVHDENCIAKINDEVDIISCAPVSKNKHFTIEKIIGE